MTDFKLCNIVDSQLEDITSELALPVVSGSTSNTYQQFNAQGGTSNTSMQFQVPVPSMATAVNRHVLAQTDIYLRVDFAGGTTANYWDGEQLLFSYGYFNSLQAFPLNALITTIQAQINNSNVTVSTRDVMPALLKMYNYEELARYNSLTPSLIDSFYQQFHDGLGSNNNVLANYSVGTFSKQYQPRGCFPVKLFEVKQDGTAGDPIKGLSIKTDANGTSPYASIIIRFTTTEPLLFLSPFISGLSKNHASFLGLNTLNITLNLGDATRVMSNASTAVLEAKNSAGESQVANTITNVTFVKGNNSRLLLNFMDIPPQLMSKIEPKNVVNYNQYMSSQQIAPQGTATLTFNNVQLGSIPSKILIFARKPILTTNFFLPITGTNFNFANRSGVLASATQVDLYNMSVRNGLQMNYYEFSGEGVSNDVITGDPELVPTIESILVIDPAIDLSIASEYSNMSKGQFNMQFSINVFNQTDETITPTMYMICVNSGVFITERGTSRYDVGLLDKEQVLDTKKQVAVMDKNTYEDTVVGGSIENLGFIHKHMKLNFHKASAKENHFDNAPGEYVHGHDAGAMSAGAMPMKSMPKRRIHKYAK